MAPDRRPFPPANEMRPLYRRRRTRAWLLIYPVPTTHGYFHSTVSQLTVDALRSGMNEWMKWQAPITLFSRPPRPRVVSNRKLVGSPGARVLVVIPPPYQFCQVFSVYPSCTHQTDYGAIARVKRSSLSEKSTAVRQQRMASCACSLTAKTNCAAAPPRNRHPLRQVVVHAK